MKLAPVPATLLFAGAGGAALLARHLASAALLAGALLVVCLRAPRARRRPYLIGALAAGAGVVLISPLLAVEGSQVLWRGPLVPVLGPLDVTVEELEIAARSGLRLAAVALAFAAYALLVDHDRLVASARLAPRSTLAVALATRLVPTLERDAAGLRDAVRGRGVPVEGARGYARLVSPLVAGSLERAAMLAEAMEARGFGRPGRTQAPSKPWRAPDRLAVVGAAALLVAGAAWL
ncbi:MAG: energy-coupling factor transporter transmembrane protein EcfT [Actinomycetota bacterium]|nr:energy-coupling factor transporter transmembrane protein EcfT [Actinomycetota bacterium]